MSRDETAPDRVHLIAHANPLGPDAKRFGFDGVDEYLAFTRRHLPRPLRLTCNQKLMKAVEEPWRGGRTDDTARVRDLQGALDDPRTLAIVAASGGAYFTRILPHLDFAVLARRRAPLWAVGFSEMSTLVNQVASYRRGRGVYWLCPNWLSTRIRPPALARVALGEFWQVLPDFLASGVLPDTEYLETGPIRGRLVAGRARSGPIRLVGGCLAVLAAIVGSPWGRRMRPDGKWLILEDIKESPYRIDRHLAALKLAGWFDRAAGLLIGDFRMMHEDTQPAVLELLRFHLPKAQKLPVVTTRSFGHVWPMSPLLLNQRVPLEIRGRDVTIWAAGRGA